MSIVILGGMVSWKLNSSISQQSESFVAHMTTHIYQNLNYPHRMFTLWLREDIRRIANDLRRSPNIQATLEFVQIKSLTSYLDTTARTEKLDFAVVFDLEGRLQASFPSETDALRIEEYYNSWKFGAHTRRFLEGDTTNETMIWDTILQLDSAMLQAFGLSDRGISEKGTLSIAATGIIKDGFGDPIGICLAGKLLNTHHKILEQVHDTTGSTIVIYSDTTPIAQAGFDNTGEEFDLSTLQISSEVQAEIYATDKTKSLVLPLAGQNYVAQCSTLASLSDERVGMFCVGVPESQITEMQQVIVSKGISARNTIQLWIMSIGVVSLVLFALVSLVIATKILNPIQQLSDISGRIATGDFQQEITIRLDDEIGMLADSFREIILYVRQAADVAQKLAIGDIRVHVTPKSEGDVFNQSFATTIQYLQEVTDVAEKIANNYLQVEVTPKSEQDILNISLQSMVTNLQAMIAENDKSMWFRTGQAELGEQMRGEQDLPALSKNIITYLAKYVQAQVGLLYLADGDHRLQLTGSYAYSTRKGDRSELQFGEGLVGQAVLEKEPLLFVDVPEDYMLISSGLGETGPRQILVVPFMYEEEVKGVIELGTVYEFMGMHKEFLNQVQENIAIAINSAQARKKMQELLEETQQQAEELQVQQEDLQKANEELEEQTTVLRESEEKLQMQQEELRQTNEELEEQAKTLEEQQKTLKNKNIELEQAQKLIEEKARDLEISSKYKSEFLANMSHELRTPLNSLLLLSQFLSENKEENLTDKQVEFARTIYASGKDLLELINDILDLSKVEAGKMTLNIEDMSLSGLASYIKQNFQHVAEEKGLELKIDLAPEVPAYVRTDRQRVEQIVKNFLSNALKFTSEGGIRFRIHRPDTTVDLSRSGLVPQYTVAISVADTGTGISKDKQRLIFEAFQQADGTTSRKYGGTGLGLSISRELTKLLGGEVHLQSEAGKGSTFTIYLPEHLEQETKGEGQETKDEEEEEGSPLLSGGDVKGSVEVIRDDRHDTSPTDKFLLIIEDDPKFAKILFDLARDKGFKGLIAGDGAAGLQLAYQYMPAAIILDIGLPGMDGWTVMKKLKEKPDTRHIPVQFISARDKSLDAMKMGAIGYLTKPVTLDKLNEAFANIEKTVSQTIKKLLVVEDNEAMRKSMLELLSSEGVAVTTVDTGQEAYRLLQSNIFDCMVLDLGLADISGFELLEKIKEDALLSQLPIAVYTGKELTREEERQLKKHAESIIIKGVKSPERLLDEVTLFLHRVEKELPEAQRRKLRMMHDKEEVLKEKTILLVDDDMRNVFALASMLEEKRLNVLICSNGKDALDMLNTRSDIDLVLMDIMMPEMDGYETMRVIRSQSTLEKLPIIALTAKAMKGDRQKCIDAGANDYLSKPVDFDKLLSLLRVWLY